MDIEHVNEFSVYDDTLEEPPLDYLVYLLLNRQTEDDWINAYYGKLTELTVGSNDEDTDTHPSNVGINFIIKCFSRVLFFTKYRLPRQQHLHIKYVWCEIYEKR